MATVMAAPITSAGRFSLLWPRASDFSRDDDNIEPRFTTVQAGDVDHLSNQPPNIIFKAGNPYVDAFAHARLDRERYLNALRMVSEFSNEYCRYNGQYPLLLSAKHSMELGY